MATVIVLRIPFFQPYVIHIPARDQILYDLKQLFRRSTRAPIFEAIESGDEKLALELAKSKDFTKWRGEWQESPLVSAIMKKRSDLACKFIAMGGTTPNDGALACAANHGDLEVVKALLAVGKNPDEPLNSKDLQNWTPLMWASNRKHTGILELLLAAGANVNAIAKDRKTAVMFADGGRTEDVKVLEILCRYKPDITIKDARGRNLIQEAISRDRNSGRPEMRKLLERYYPEINFDV
jgi:hypothetical protein